MQQRNQSLPWLVLGLCAGALLVFLLLLQATHGPIVMQVSAQPAAGRSSAPEPIPTESDGLPVTVIDSAASAAHFAAMPGATPDVYPVHVAAWRRALEALHADVRFAGDEALLEPTADNRVLVLPSVTVLSDQAVTTLAARIAQGQAVVASWQLGLYRPDDSWRGYGVLEQWLGVHTVPAPPDGAVLRFGVTRPGRPLSVGLPAGGRFEIQPFDAPLLLATADADAEWRRWELLPLDPNTPHVSPAATVHRTLGKGRIAWLNFQPASAIAASQPTTTILLKNALRWTVGLPRVTVDRWPGGAGAALMMGVDTEDRFENAAAAADLFKQHGVPGTFFCLSSLAERHPAVVTQLAAAGEIGSHTDDHQVVAGRPQAEQAQHLRASATALQHLVAEPVQGFRPPEEESDDATLHALAESGYEYLAGPRTKDRAEPTLHSNGIVSLPRIVRDDIYWINHGIGDQAEALAAGFLADVQQVQRLGGLAFLSVHTQTLGRPAVRQALASVLTSLAREPLWRATGRDIARWWVARDGITVRAELPNAQRLQLTITSRIAVDDIGFTVFLPRRPDRLELGGGVADPPKELRVLTGPDAAIRMVFERLGAGATRVVDIDLH